MSPTQLIDGRAIATQIKQEVQAQVMDLQSVGIRPGLATVMVGENPASEIYVGSKIRTCQELGLHSAKLEYPANVTTKDLLTVIEELNGDDLIDGILVQLPLPQQIDPQAILLAISPEKDVDGFHPVNVGKLVTGQDTLFPCTPAGIIEILKRSSIPIEGRHAVVLGRSNVVGKPLAMLLLRHHATVTICHSRTEDIASVSRHADILVAAIGRAGFVTDDFVRPGAVVIDVGMNRVTDRDSILDFLGKEHPRLEHLEKKGSVLIGDIHPRRVSKVAGHLTPVPGGVGPLTIAMLMSNTVKAAMLRRDMNQQQS